MDWGHVTAKLYLQRDNNSYVCCIYNNIIKTACITITTKKHMTSIYIIRSSQPLRGEEYTTGDYDCTNSEIYIRVGVVD